MKKIAIVFLAAMLLLAACGSRTEAVSPAPEPEYAGIYRQSWQEEIGGTVIDLNAYIVLNEDGTGYWIAQDVGTLTWEAGRLKLTIGEEYDMALTRENGIVELQVCRFRDADGERNPTVFEKIEALPGEIAQMLG